MVYSNLSYAELRALADDGDLVFFHRTNTVWSDLVAFATNSIFTHVNMVFWASVAGTPRLMCVEAAFGSKRRLLSMSYYDNRTFTLVKVPRPWNAIADIALARVGVESYGTLGVMYVGLRDFCAGRLNIRLPALDTRHEICSEFMASLLKLSDTALSPQGLFDAVTQSGS